MKHMKKIASFLLAAIMVLAVATTVFAADKPTITAPAGSAHTYKVYQIFTGDLSGSVLSNVKWGKNGTGTKDETVSDTILNALTALNSVTVDATKLTEIEKYVNLAGAEYGTVTAGRPLEVDPGYYLIKDEGPATGQDFYSEYIVKIAGGVTISPKGDIPSSEKKVKDTNDTDGTTSGWQDSADYDINDEIPYQLTATIPADVKLSNYDKYVVTFVDTISKGLTYKAGSAKISVDGADATALADPSIVDYSGAETAYTGGKVLTWDLGDIKATRGVTTDSAHTIVVTYTATLNSNAVIGEAGNPNKFHITFYNNPNNSGSGTPNTGETPDDVNKVFTYKVEINKVTATSEPLKGADFTLYKEVKDGTISGAKTGATIKTELAASNSAIKATDLADAKYYIVVGKETVSSETTKFEFKHLDDGKYVLVETKIPDTYNAANSYAFTITATHSETEDDPVLLTLSVDDTTNFTATKASGVISASIVNNQGSTLPTTGGIGTTIFYVLGSILVLGAVILLATRRRMSR